VSRAVWWARNECHQRILEWVCINVVLQNTVNAMVEIILSRLDKLVTPYNHDVGSRLSRDLNTTWTVDVYDVIACSVRYPDICVDLNAIWCNKKRVPSCKEPIEVALATWSGRAPPDLINYILAGVDNPIYAEDMAWLFSTLSPAPDGPIVRFLLTAYTVTMWSETRFLIHAYAAGVRTESMAYILDERNLSFLYKCTMLPNLDRKVISALLRDSPESSLRDLFIVIGAQTASFDFLADLFVQRITGPVDPHDAPLDPLHARLDVVCSALNSLKLDPAGVVITKLLQTPLAPHAAYAVHAYAASVRPESMAYVCDPVNIAGSFMVCERKLHFNNKVLHALSYTPHIPLHNMMHMLRIYGVSMPVFLRWLEFKLHTATDPVDEHSCRTELYYLAPKEDAAAYERTGNDEFLTAWITRVFPDVADDYVDSTLYSRTGVE